MIVHSEERPLVWIDAYNATVVMPQMASVKSQGDSRISCLSFGRFDWPE